MVNIGRAMRQDQYVFRGQLEASFSIPHMTFQLRAEEAAVMERIEYDSACIFVLNPDSRLNHPTAQGELWALHVHSLHPNSEPE